ncbi:MAG: hypothetical protein IJN22_05775 [Clostridia bacterium]|nr:hypothetical protein [Clostridia bacterium]
MVGAVIFLFEIVAPAAYNEVEKNLKGKIISYNQPVESFENARMGDDRYQLSPIRRSLKKNY